MDADDLPYEIREPKSCKSLNNFAQIKGSIEAMTASRMESGPVYFPVRHEDGTAHVPGVEAPLPPRA